MMKKVIQSKPVSTVKCYSQRQLPGPKTLISNNWLIRNDSANIQAILNPDLQLKKPRKHIKKIPDEPVGKKQEAYRKNCLSSNTCYCKDKPTRPVLFKRPTKCLSLEQFEEKSNGTNLRGLSKARTSLHCFCKGPLASAKHIDLTNTETLKKLQDELDEASKNLAITDQRKDYETYRGDQQEQYLREIAEYEDEYEDGTIKSNPLHHSSRFIRDGLTSQDLEHFENTESYGDESGQRPSTGSKFSSKKTLDTVIDGTTFKNSSVFSTANNNSSMNDGDMEVQKLRKFRDNNYFETHDIDEHLSETIPEHTCVHQFSLDDRLLPQAVSVDRYGKSRCTICSKPMDGKTHTEKSFFSDKITREKIKKFSKCIELGLVPHDINIGTPAKIQLKVKTDEILKLGKFIGGYQRPCNTNTFALRQQKMATNWRYK